MQAQELIYQLIEKSIVFTTDALNLSHTEDIEQVSLLINKRDEVFHIFLSSYERLESSLDQEYKNQLSQLINKIIEMDDVILENLEAQKEKVQIDIAKLFKNRENFKGYNLNALK